MDNNSTGPEDPELASGRRKHRYRIKVKERKKVRLRHRAPIKDRMSQIVSKKWKPFVTAVVLILLVGVTVYFVFEIFSDASNKATILRRLKVGK
jgi:hypothetical protein